MRVMSSFCSALNMGVSCHFSSCAYTTSPLSGGSSQKSLAALQDIIGNRAIVSALILTLIRSRAMQKEHGHTVETAVEARAGFRDRPVLVVLTISVLLSCVLFALIYMGFFAH
jgi:hypothetical protein